MGRSRDLPSSGVGRGSDKVGLVDSRMTSSRSEGKNIAEAKMCLVFKLEEYDYPSSHKTHKNE